MYIRRGWGVRKRRKIFVELSHTNAGQFDKYKQK